MTISTLTMRSGSHSLGFDISDVPLLDADGESVTATHLNIRYEVWETFHGSIGSADYTLTEITYEVTGGDGFDTVHVHPDYLDKPEAWPDWVQALVDEHVYNN